MTGRRPDARGMAPARKSWLGRCRPIALAGLLALRTAHAGSADAMAVLDAARREPQTLLLEVQVNGEPTPLLARFETLQGRLYAHPDVLREIGVAAAALGATADRQIPLDTIPGLEYHYDEAAQRLDLQLPDRIREPYRVELHPTHESGPAGTAHGVVLNYDLFARPTSDERAALETEVRYFTPAGVLANTGIAYAYRGGGGRYRYTRNDTGWTQSDRARLTTLEVGDAISTSLAWSRAVRFGGVQWRSDFTLRPDLVTSALPSFAGSSAVPSALDVYINNVRQAGTRVPSGPFVVNAITGLTGAGTATIVTQDALGRSVSTTVPLYIDARLLAQGRSSYAVEAGFLRHAYGVASFDYDGRPALSASWRHGLADMLTVEAHTEATPGVLNGGIGALARLGTAGVMDASIAASTGRLAGWQAGLGYQYIAASFSVNAHTLRSFGHYGDLAARDGTPVALSTDQFSLSLPLASRQALSFSYVGESLSQAPMSRIASVAYTLRLGSRISVNLSTYRDFGASRTRGGFVSLTVGLDRNTSLNATVGRQSGASSYDVSAIRPADYDGGFGWGVQADAIDSAAHRAAQIQYVGRGGEATAAIERSGDRVSPSLDVTGALVFMDHDAVPARRVSDAFALVSTDGVANVPVLHAHRPIGKTDGAGHFLVPDLNAYEENAIGIDSTALPIDAKVGATDMAVVPQRYAGVLAHFGITRYRAASVILLGPTGAPLPAGTRVHQQTPAGDTIVGYDGLAFIENLSAKNRLITDAQGTRCTFDFDYTDTSAPLPTLGPLQCGAPQAVQP